ncbi:MAG: bifunctional nuclease family protein [Tannerella sp.]|nr:bifunctional nuclease family protein [Tannerella sp.]
MDGKVKLKVQGLTNSQMQSGAYALILSEDGPRRLPVIVGVSEAQSIAIALEGLRPPRPLTHDLFVRFAGIYGIRLLEVLIYKFEEGIFYSEMLFSDGSNEIRIDSRTSDAVAIALRMQSNVYTYESIIQKCGIVLNERNSPDEKEELILTERMNPEEIHDNAKIQEWVRLLANGEIKERMEKAICEENYEFAKIYKEELLRREREGDDS